MTWTKQLMFVRRSPEGVITAISETVPPNYQSTTIKDRDKAYRATENVEEQIKEYAKRKKTESRLFTGGD